MSEDFVSIVDLYGSARIPAFERDEIIREGQTRWPGQVIGLIIVGGFIEALDFRGSDAYTKSKEVDSIAVLFRINASYPPPRGQKGRPAIYTDFDGRGHGLAAMEFHKMKPLVKTLIEGVENQLVRRVTLVVVEGLMGKLHFVTVPKTKQERWQEAKSAK